MLASEGGRTSRGSIGNMREYVVLLNRLHASAAADLDAIEAFWIARVHEFFAAKPFRIRLDASRSLRLVVRDVLAQAEERQKSVPGVYYAGAVMQHMVGAKLDCALGPGGFEPTATRASNEQTGRKGDFFLGDVVIHFTASPSRRSSAMPRQRQRRVSPPTDHRPARVDGRRSALENVVWRVRRHARGRAIHYDQSR